MSHTAGFHIEKMKMKSGKKTLWECPIPALLESEEEIKIEIPKEILKCKQVQREIVFSTKEAISSLSLVQEIRLHDKEIELWEFDFGFVMPNSTNSWESIVESKDNMMPVQILNGNVTIITTFYDNDKEIISNCARVFYV
ncbi:hypothetical protein ABK040_005748 [Willaertia magna]